MIKYHTACGLSRVTREFREFYWDNKLIATVEKGKEFWIVKLADGSGIFAAESVEEAGKRLATKCREKEEKELAEKRAKKIAHMQERVKDML
jgi:prefoldin subunit 5